MHKGYPILGGGDMAEFCADCWKIFFASGDTEGGYVLSKTLYLCEGCAQLKRVVIEEKPRGWFFSTWK